MNTPAHLLVNLAVLARSGEASDDGTAPPLRGVGWVTSGALLPDLPMFGFYLWQRLVLETPERIIWGETYFREDWQRFFDVFNSIPLGAAGLLVAWMLSHRGATLLFASALLHCLLDLALHHDDAHGHFFPFTSWHFESPVSYWDPSHYGQLGAGVEVALVAASSLLLWPRVRSRRARTALAALCVLYAVGYVSFYLL